MSAQDLLGGDFDAAAFGKRIGTLREQRRMSLQEVGIAAGFTKSHVWELETGRARNPTVRAVWALSRALGVTPAYMLGLSPEMISLDPMAMDIACQVDRALRAREMRGLVTLAAAAGEGENG